MRQTSCTRCGHDIEGSEREGWHDRGGGSECLAYQGDGEFVYPRGHHTTRPVKWGVSGTNKRRSPMTGRMVSYPESWTTRHGRPDGAGGYEYAGHARRKATRAQRRAGMR